MAAISASPRLPNPSDWFFRSPWYVIDIPWGSVARSSLCLMSAPIEPLGRPTACENTVTAGFLSTLSSFVGPVDCVIAANWFSSTSFPSLFRSVRSPMEATRDLSNSSRKTRMSYSSDPTRNFESLSPASAVWSVAPTSAMESPSAAIFCLSMLILVSGFPSSLERRTSALPGTARTMSATCSAERRVVS